MCWLNVCRTEDSRSFILSCLITLFQRSTYSLFAFIMSNFPWFFFPLLPTFWGKEEGKKKHLEVILAWIWQVFWKAEIKQEISHFSRNMTEGERYRCLPELSPFPAVECWASQEPLLNIHHPFASMCLSFPSQMPPEEFRPLLFKDSILPSFSLKPVIYLGR